MSRHKLRSPGHCLAAAGYACRGSRTILLFMSHNISDRQLRKALRPFFPGLAAHDLYRFSNIDGLLDWGADEMSETFSPPKTVKVQELLPSAHFPSLPETPCHQPEELHFEILACALRFPGAVDTPGAFWSMLLKDDQDEAPVAGIQE